MSFRYAKQKPKYGFIPQNLLGRAVESHKAKVKIFTNQLAIIFEYQIYFE